MLRDGGICRLRRRFNRREDRREFHDTGPTIASKQDLLLVLKGERFAVRCAGKGFNRLTQAQSRERHLVGVKLAES